MILQKSVLKGKMLESVLIEGEGRCYVFLETRIDRADEESIVMRGAYTSKHAFHDLIGVYSVLDSSGNRHKRLLKSIRINSDLAPLLDDIAYLSVGWSNQYKALVLRIRTKSGAIFPLQEWTGWNVHDWSEVTEESQA